jgi:integrase
LILTNMRTNAVLKAAWSDFDLDAAVWTVPLTSLRDRKHRAALFRVPLPPRVLAILREMEPARSSTYVLCSARGKPLSNMALLTLLKRMNGSETRWIDPASGRSITAHGFRATFRTWAEELATFPHAVVEQSMGHGAIALSCRKNKSLR